jgi:large subunit ribosomal protein L3
MAGRMGSDTVTVRNLKVMAIDPQTRTLTVSGLVPGAANSLLTITITKSAAKA